MNKKKIKIGIVSFSHAPNYSSNKDREDYVKADYEDICSKLKNEGFEIEAPLFELREGADYKRFGLSEPSEIKYSVDKLLAANIDCLIIQLSQWTRIALAVDIIKSLNVPSALVADTDNRFAGEATAAAVASSILEAANTKNLLFVKRFQDFEIPEIVKWIKGAGSLSVMKRSRLLSLGGGYGADIPYTRDDEAVLENMFSKEIITEQEFVIIENARKMIDKDPGRISNFVNWLSGSGINISYDSKMLTSHSLAFQSAQYLAVRDRLEILKDEDIIGVSIKCHFEVSTDCAGCTECLIAGFLPFDLDNEGKKEIIPVACEGDIKGLITIAMMSIIKPEIPPLFGDLIKYKKDYIIMSNCGSSSVYWASRSNNSFENLKKVSLLPQVHGKSGGAVFYKTPEGPVTFARLFKINGRYFMYVGKADILNQDKIKDDISLPWPRTFFNLGSDHNLFFKTAPCNHGCITEGDVVSEIIYFCELAGIKVIRSDSIDSMKNHISELGS